MYCCVFLVLLAADFRYSLFVHVPTLWWWDTSCIDHLHCSTDVLRNCSIEKLERKIMYNSANVSERRAEDGFSVCRVCLLCSWVLDELTSLTVCSLQWRHLSLTIRQKLDFLVLIVFHCVSHNSPSAFLVKLVFNCFHLISFLFIFRDHLEHSEIGQIKENKTWMLTDYNNFGTKVWSLWFFFFNNNNYY